MTHKLPYRPCVGLCLFNQDGLVFVGERLDSPGAWQMPQGGIDPGENVETAALRELKEEVGTDNAQIIRIHQEHFFYDIPQDVLDRIPWGKEFGGQEQTWVALRFMGKDDEINLEAHTHPEFSRYQWLPLREVPNMIVPFKIETYQQVAEAFKDIG
jgi:putative (di)nucleoside polyphosphate hydrolase